MSDQSNDNEPPDELEDLTDEAEELVEEQSLIVNSDAGKMYYFEIQSGNVFAGTLPQFEQMFFIYPPGMTDEHKLNNIKIWADDQGWSFQVDWIH